MIKKLDLNMDIVNYSESKTLRMVYHGEVKSETTGYKYIVIYSSLSRQKIYMYKLRGVNIEKTKLKAADFNVPIIFFD